MATRTMLLWTTGAKWATKFVIPLNCRVTSSWKPLTAICGEVPLLLHQAGGHSGTKSGDCRKGRTTKRNIDIADKKLRHCSDAGLVFFHRMTRYIFRSITWFLVPKLNIAIELQVQSGGGLVCRPKKMAGLVEVDALVTELLLWFTLYYIDRGGYCIGRMPSMWRRACFLHRCVQTSLRYPFYLPSVPRTTCFILLVRLTMILLYCC